MGDRVCFFCLLNHASFNEAGTEDILSQTHTELTEAKELISLAYIEQNNRKSFCPQMLPKGMTKKSDTPGSVIAQGP